MALLVTSGPLLITVYNVLILVKTPPCIAPSQPSSKNCTHVDGPIPSSQSKGGFVQTRKDDEGDEQANTGHLAVLRGCEIELGDEEISR